MEPLHPLLSIQQSLRFTCPPSHLLQDLSHGGALYVHARNWLAELAAITPLTGLVLDEEEQCAFFPEEGLHLSLASIEAVHGIAIEHRSHPALALEFATRGEPRALSIAAIPNFSDVERFSHSLNRHAAEIVPEEAYQQWRSDAILRPSICPCCVAAAEDRRENPEKNPLTRIFCNAIEERLVLRCTATSALFNFSTWLAPKSIQISGGVVGVIGDDGKSMLEIDLGFCFSLRIHVKRIDAETFSTLKVYDSAGNLHLELATHGSAAEAAWRGLCQQA